MSESKELLEATVKGLQHKLELLQTELNVKTLELNNINKPKLNQSTLDIIYDCVTEGVQEFDFSDVDNYEFEPEFDYDNKIVIGSIEMNDTSYIVESIMNKIDKYFKVLPTNTEENTVTEVQKVI